MLTIGQIFRLLTIQRVLVKHGLDELVFALHLFSSVRWLQKLLPWNWFRKTGDSMGVRLRLALEDLGPIYVKFGQLMSTRRDMLPDDVAMELAKLQDKVPPFPGRIARDIIEQALGKRVGEVFREFDETPLASASVAQVHAATLKGWPGDDRQGHSSGDNKSDQPRSWYHQYSLRRARWSDTRGMQGA